MEQRYFRVKNFEKFQHYGKSRIPPWIKLYNKILENYEFSRLDDASKLHLILIWLLASRQKNKIPWDTSWVQKKIGAMTVVNLEELKNAGFIEDYVDMEEEVSTDPKNDGASKMLATCYQNASTPLLSININNKNKRESAEREKTEMLAECYQNASKEKKVKKVKPLKKKDIFDDQFLQVFEFWRKERKHFDANPATADRRKAVIDRLKEEFTVEQINLGTYGIQDSDWHMGRHKDNTVIYDDLTHICSRGALLDKLISLGRKRKDREAAEKKRFESRDIDRSELDRIYEEKNRKNHEIPFSSETGLTNVRKVLEALNPKKKDEPKE